MDEARWGLPLLHPVPSVQAAGLVVCAVAVGADLPELAVRHPDLGVVLLGGDAADVPGAVVDHPVVEAQPLV